MRFALPVIVAMFGSAQVASAVCCYYGAGGSCARAVSNPLLRIRADVAELPTRAVCCCTAANAAGCETRCVSFLNAYLFS